MKPLNQAQQKAVEHVRGPLLIVAGAGTGKTTVITQKISYLIKNNLAKPEEILALAFNEKAATEILDRVDEILDIGYAEMEICTFHAFCQKILERYGLEIGLSNQFKLLTETDAWLLIRQNLDKFDLDYYRPLGNPSKHIHELIRHFSKCKDELITPRSYLEYAEGQQLDKDDVRFPEEEIKRVRELSNAYHVYNQLLLDNNSLDFGDLIFYTIQLLEKRPAILEALQKRFKYILVDEFQDVNWAQYYLVRKLVGKNNQLTVVGDDDQSIYAFRGASVSNILRFKDDFPDSTEIVLNENYRSRQEILDLSYKLIQNNNPDRLEVKLKIDKKLVSKAEDNGEKSVCHIHVPTLDMEVQSVIDEIIKIKENNPEVVWDDFAILVRANNHADPFINLLEKRHLPYEYLSSVGLYRQPIVLDGVNFFRVIDNYYDSAAIYRLMCLPFLGFKENDLQKIIHQAHKKSIGYYEALKRVEEFGVSAEGAILAQKLISFMHNGMKRARYSKPTTVLYEFLNESGYLNYLTKEEAAGNRQIIRQIYQLKQFFDYLAKFETTISGAKVKQFLEQYDYVLESGDKGSLYQATDTPDSINIMTVHASKGLEFKYVFLVNLVEERVPSRARGGGIEIPVALIKEQLPEGDSHYQEERRLFYVGITRAKQRLYLTSADDYGGARAKKISRFLSELDFMATKKDRSEEKTALDISAPIEKNETGEFFYELPKAFSFSQVKSYDTCPYQYKLAHILKIPVRGTASFSFGQSLHGTLQEFYQKIQALNQVEQANLFTILEPTTVAKTAIKVPNLDELQEMYKKHWMEDWYKDETQRNKYYKKGEEIIKIFYKTQENNWTIPVCLESWFKIKVGDYLVHGRIDRVDQLPDGTLGIIDYKTGKAKEKVVGEDKDQLLIYQIAAEQLPEYQILGQPSQLTYFYLNDNVKVSFLGTEKEKEKLKERLKEIIDKIHSKNFVATPSKFACDHCDFRDICDFRE